MFEFETEHLKQRQVLLAETARFEEAKLAIHPFHGLKACLTDTLSTIGTGGHQQ